MLAGRGNSRARQRRRSGSSLSDVLRYVPEGAYRPQTRSRTQPRRIPNRSPKVRKRVVPLTYSWDYHRRRNRA